MKDDPVTWSPAMDVFEIDGNYVLNAEVPGVERRDIKIEFSGSELVVRGERKMDAVCARESYHRLEGHGGKFYRVFLLPEPVDSSRMQVKLKDGVLHVVLPKSADEKDHRGEPIVKL